MLWDYGMLIVYGKNGKAFQERKFKKLINFLSWNTFVKVIEFIRSNKISFY
jgi:hypothetical protein